MAYRTRTQTSGRPLARPERLKVGFTPVLSTSSSSSSDGGPDLDFEDSWNVHEPRGKRKLRAKSSEKVKVRRGRGPESKAKPKGKGRGKGKQRASTPSSGPSESAVTHAPDIPPQHQRQPKCSRSGRRIKPPIKLQETEVDNSNDQVDRDVRDGREPAPSPTAPIDDAEAKTADDGGRELEDAIDSSSPKSGTSQKPKPKRQAANKRGPPKKTIARGRKRVRIDETQNTVRAIKSRFRARLSTGSKGKSTPVSQPRRTTYPLTRTIKLLHPGSFPPPTGQQGGDSEFAVSSDSSDGGDTGHPDELNPTDSDAGDDGSEGNGTSTDESNDHLPPRGPCAPGNRMTVDLDTLFPSSEERTTAGPSAVLKPAQEQGLSAESRQSTDEEAPSRVAPVTHIGGRRDLGLLRFLARWSVPSFDLMANIARAAEDPSLASPDEMADALQTSSPDRWDVLVDTACTRTRDLPPPTRVAREGGLRLTLYRPPLAALPVIPEVPEVPERPSWNFEKSRQVLASGRPYLHDRVQALRTQRH